MAKEYLEKLSTFIDQATSGRHDNVNLDCKHFFSGAALYADGRICITLTPVGLALKLPERTKDRLIEDKKAVFLRYFPKGPIKKDYALFTRGVEKDGKALRSYVNESIDFAVTLPRRKENKK